VLGSAGGLSFGPARTLWRWKREACWAGLRDGARGGCDPGGTEAIAAGKNGGPDRLGRIDHIVVIYQENHSGNFVVDHDQHDTTSILATIEQRFGLPAVATRDARVATLATVFGAKQGG
jgi:hypothetical protein